jgi:membrane associated rhomboid family serine protease
MFIPLYDHKPLVHVRRQFVTWGLIIANVAIFVLVQQGGLSDPAMQASSLSYGLIPAVLFDARDLAPHLAVFPEPAALLTYAFLHGSWMHLGGNMLYLWIFGNNVEDALGRVRFILFYLACGVAAALLQAFVDPQSTIPMIGASGAISGVLGAYLLLFPRANVLVLIPLGWFTQLRPLPAVFVLGFYFVLQLISAALDDGQGGVAFYAHIGGFIAGMVLLPLMKRGEVRLFSQKRQPPRPAVRIRRRRRPWDRQQGPWG